MKQVLYACAIFVLFFSCASTNTATNQNMLADVEPFSIGTANIFVDQIFSSKLKGTEAEVIFHPRQNEVELDIKSGLGENMIFFNEAGRARFIEALGSYKEDFANRTLTTSYRKSRAAYGKAKGRLLWKPLSISLTYRASPYTEFGYRFNDKSPYFAIYQDTAKEETKSNSDMTDSPKFSVYFTIAQAEELAKLFDQAFLLQIVGVVAPEIPSENEGDVY